MMTLEEFKQLSEKEPPPQVLPPVLQALWYDKKGNWDTAHEIVQNANDPDSAWIHAYLHRKEGDLTNARYWYRRSNQPEFKGGLDQEWEQIASMLLIKVSEKWMQTN